MSASKSSAAKSRGQRSTEETDSDDNSLKINLDKRPPRKRTRKALNDERLERTIQETINKCPNITPDAVKKMLLVKIHLNVLFKSDIIF